MPLENEMPAADLAESEKAVVRVGDYLNKGRGEEIERECRQMLNQGYRELVMDFSATEIVNSVGISILLGVIDSAKGTGAKVVFSEVKQDTAELFDLLGLTKHVTITA